MQVLRLDNAVSTINGVLIWEDQEDNLLGFLSKDRIEGLTCYRYQSPRRTARLELSRVSMWLYGRITPLVSRGSSRNRRLGARSHGLRSRETIHLHLEMSHKANVPAEVDAMARRIGVWLFHPPLT
jgi:hypothetical protein